MGNIGLPELLVVLVIALLFIGPKRLPEIAKAIGEAIRAFQDSFKGPTPPSDGDGRGADQPSR